MSRAGRERAEEQRGGLRPVPPSPAEPPRRPLPRAPPRPRPRPSSPRAPAPAARARPPEPVRAYLSPCAGAMAEQESLEFGKADFVLMDTVSMPEFMANLRLR